MSDDFHSGRPILLIGGQGKTGRRVAARLTAQGRAVRPASRSTRPSFDWNDASTWDESLKGASSAYVAYVPDLAVLGAADAVEALAKTAREFGVERFVLLSGRGEPGAQEAEARTLRILPRSTVLRCSWFSQNFTESFFRNGVLAGEIAAPVGAVREPFVDADDIADAAVAVLTKPGHDGRVYELTGPRALSFAEAAAIIARATGRAVAFRSPSLDDYLSELSAAGVPKAYRGLLAYLFSEVLDGRNAEPQTGVQTILKREPRSFEAFAEDAAETGLWTPQRDRVD